MESDGFLSRQEVVCPPDLLRRAAGQGPAVTAIVGADYPVVLESVRQAQAVGIITPVLIGSRSGIEVAAQGMGWDISGFEIVEASGEASAAQVGADLASSGAVAMSRAKRFSRFSSKRKLTPLSFLRMFFCNTRPSFLRM